MYLASPNKWWLTDPHYKLPFISWLPRRLAAKYLLLFRKRKWDIYSVSLNKLKKLAGQNGFVVQDITWDVMSNPEKYDVNFPKKISRVMRVTPSPVKAVLLHFVPTHIKILKIKD